ncbi:MAG: nitroreductase family protein, partial [Nitrospinae bacterium]|nr:nitroreductase family protein [Nitrospinota bacterium]
MNIIEAIENRRSIRTFKPDPIPDGILEKIIKTAGRSPSYTNTQPWEIAVVRGKTRDDLSRNLYNAASSDTPITPDIPKPSTWPEELDRRSKEHGERRFKVLGIERDDAVKRKDLRLQNFKFYGAPAVLFIFIDKGLSEWSVMDIGMFAQ